MPLPPVPLPDKLYAVIDGTGGAASCKSGQRLKQSGMHWTVRGADAIATLRCQQASRPEDQIWRARRNQAPAA